MSLTASELTPADIAAVTNKDDTWGGGSMWWLIVLFLFCFMGWGGNWNGGGTAPFAAGALTQADVQSGFDQAAVINGINGINAGMNTGFANAEVSRCNTQANLLQTMNANNAAVLQQMNTMAYNQLGNANSAQAGMADLKYTIATENCADRNALSQSLMSLQAENRANTQAILDKMCQQEIEAKNDTINQLRQQLNLANLSATQNQQTGQLMADNAAQTQSLVSQLRTPSPVPAYVVPNPYGCNCGYSGSGCCGA